MICGAFTLATPALLKVSISFTIITPTSSHPNMDCIPSIRQAMKLRRKQVLRLGSGIRDLESQILDLSIPNPQSPINLL